MALFFNAFSLTSGCVLSDFASDFRPGASAHRFTKSQSEWNRANALRLIIDLPYFSRKTLLKRDYLSIRYCRKIL